MRRTLLCLVMLLAIAIPAMAGQPFVVLVDVENGLLLIPEGTAVPRGVDFYLDPEIVPMAQTPDSVVETPAPRRLVWAYANDDERFVAARKRIAETQPAESKASGYLVDQWYYFTFEDGSYHGVYKYVYQAGLYTYGVRSLVHDVGGDYDANVSVIQTSPYSFFNDSKYCSFEAAAGTCTIPTRATGTQTLFSTTVTSKGSIVRYLYWPCDSPCKQNRSSTITISFP